MLTKEELPYCPVAVTVRVIGNKWKLLLIRNLLSAPQRFTELKKGVTGISQKVLTENLRSLERDGIVRREVFAEIPPKVVFPVGAWQFPAADFRRHDRLGKRLHEKSCGKQRVKT